MKKIANKIINEMGRSRKDALNKFYSLREPLADHLIKIYSFGKAHRKENLNKWIQEVNAWILDLRKFSVQKGGKGKNYSKEFLKDKLNNENFETLEDVQIVLNYLKDEGYPEIKFTNKDLVLLKALASRVINLILSNRGKLTVEQNDLR